MSTGGLGRNQVQLEYQKGKLKVKIVAETDCDALRAKEFQVELVELETEKLGIAKNSQRHIISNAQFSHTTTYASKKFLKSVELPGGKFEGVSTFGWVDVGKDEEGMILFSTRQGYPLHLRGIQAKANKYVHSVLPSRVGLKELRVGYVNYGQKLVVVAQADENCLPPSIKSAVEFNIMFENMTQNWKLETGSDWDRCTFTKAPSQSQNGWNTFVKLFEIHPALESGYQQPCFRGRICIGAEKKVSRVVLFSIEGSLEGVWKKEPTPLAS